MNFTVFVISMLITSGFVVGAFAQTYVEKEFTEDEIEKMRETAVLMTMEEGTLTIEFYPDDAPNTVYNFLKLVESGYYDGVVFHRIIPGFMIQAGDPNTKNPETDRKLWGSGGPGYAIKEEFNALQHDRGIISMARSQHVDSAGSQFFIVQRDSNFLDGEYTAFGRLVPGTHSLKALDNIASYDTDEFNAPLDVNKATIKSAQTLYPYFASGLGEPQRNESVIRPTQTTGGEVDVYHNTLHNIKFNLPYRWMIIDDENNKVVIMEPRADEHNTQKQIEISGFTPQVLVLIEPRTVSEIQTGNLNPGFFSIRGGDDPEILSNYIHENFNATAKLRAHTIVTTQNLQTENESTKFKIIQIHFNNSQKNYSIIYVNTEEWFRYEINAFLQVIRELEFNIDGKLQKAEFYDSPVFKQIIEDHKAPPEPEPTPPARIGGCLIATATFDSELAPQVQLLREIRDNMVSQTESGSAFMVGFNQFYYSFSPTIADYERENPVFKEAVKVTLTPLLTSLTLLQYADIDSEHEMLGYGIGLILLNIGMYFVAPAILITKIRSFYKLQ